MEQKGVHKYAALRVPQGWTNQDRALIIQLEKLFDELYAKFGRIRMIDLAEELRELLNQYGDDIGTLQDDMDTAQDDIDTLEETTVTDVAYNSSTQRLTKTINGIISDIVAIATLDGNGKVPASQLPGYVDDVEEYADLAHFPAAGEADKIYVAMDTGFTYRWSGTQYVRLNTYDPATQSASGLMSAADKTKLDGVEAGAQVNPGAATTSTAGLMSAADKTKLNGVAEGATANIGTITEIRMNGASKGTSGSVDLGTVITAHQDISGKADKSATVSTVTYDSTNKKITKTINGTTTDVVTVAALKSALGAFTWGNLANQS